MNLEEGDVLSFEFPAARPLDLTLNGQTKYFGEIVNAGRRTAFRVTERLREQRGMTAEAPSSQETSSPETRLLAIRRSIHDGSERLQSDPGAELIFPAGIPGFEDERRMLPVEIPSQRPLIYLQSLANPEICFAALPVFVIDPGFRLSLSEEERCALQLPEDCEPVIGADVLCLALLMSGGDGVRVNLNAPVVINLHNSRGVQSIAAANATAYFRLEENGRWEPRC